MFREELVWGDITTSETAHGFKIHRQTHKAGKIYSDDVFRSFLLILGCETREAFSNPKFRIPATFWYVVYQKCNQQHDDRTETSG